MAALQKIFLWVSTLFFFSTLSGCSIIGDIFKAGVFVGVLVVVVVVALIVFIFRKMSNRN
jgi:uncharacterized membrane protein